MRKPVKLLFAFLPLLLIPIALSCLNKGNVQADPLTNYANHCAGCHGTELKTFISREWKFSESETDVQDIIAEGMPDYGMPSFNKLFTDQEIIELSNLLWVESQKMDSDEGLPDNLELIESADQAFAIDTLIVDLDVPWGIEFLPDGHLLITERSGDLLMYKEDVFVSKIGGVPTVFAKGQGGLLDIELHPDYHLNGWIYLSYSYPDESGKNGNTAIMRARLSGTELIDQQVIFKGTPMSSRGVHFGSKLEFDRDHYLYFSIGERGNPSNAQTLENHSGKIHRIHDDGRIPKDNPYINTPGAMPSIFSYGHRNPQGVAMHPETGLIWVHEHGPKGGDEVNIIGKGNNYGWPVITYGINYDGTTITEETHKEGMEQPFVYWIPSIAPCGMGFVTGDRYPGWEGDLLVGSLSFTYLHRVDLNGRELVKEEKLLEKIGRVRTIEMSPDGLIYLAVERPGMILRLLPASHVR